MKGIASTVQKREFLQGFLPAYHREFALGHGCAAQFVRETVFEHWTRKFPTTPLDTKKEQQIIHWFYNRKLTKRRTTEAQQKPPHSETWNQDIALPDWNQDIALRDWKEYVAFPDWNEGDFALPDLNADQGQQAVEEMFVPMDPLPPTVTESPPGTLPPTESRATLPEAVNNGLEARIEKLARDLDAIVQENPTFSFFIQMGGVLNGTLQHLHYSGTSQNGQHYPEYYANSRGDDTGAQLLYQDFQAYLIAQQECLGAYPQLSLVEDRAPIHLFRCALEVYLAKTWDWDDDLGSSDSSDSDTQPKPPSFKKLVAYHEPQSMLVVESGPLVTSFRLARRSSEKAELPTASASAIIADSLDPITQYQETEHNGIVDYQGAGNAPDRNWPKIMSVPNGAPSTPANSYQRPQRLRRPPSISIRSILSMRSSCLFLMIFREGRSFITPGARQEAANAQERHQKKASNHSRRAKRKKY
ncbi:hypothetical protein PHLCEN_2v3182 [Hermanssonia centrifuga]|uniref:Uncharacterized protein n=1 Tax=Hermanssonia centrifuga TaxID=98765 RepID=A0A2R6R0X8_9APHY|nr:hypothetical protein PHLCEN_2v3182 [Hermanssonia centrifuga]